MLEYREERPWIEPFVGGGNMIDKVGGVRIGYDINQDAIDALILIRDGVESIASDNTNFTENDYKEIPRGLNNKTPHQAFAAFAYSFGGKHLGGWARGNKSSGEPRDYVNEANRNAVKQSPFLQGVHFEKKPFQDISLSQSCLIYCDPPYKRTTGYKTRSFNHELFWKWCQRMSNEGHVVFVSEYSGPEYASIVWEKEVNSSLTKNTGSKKATEKLFLVKRST